MEQGSAKRKTKTGTKTAVAFFFIMILLWFKKDQQLSLRAAYLWLPLASLMLVFE